MNMMRANGPVAAHGRTRRAGWTSGERFATFATLGKSRDAAK